MLDSVDTLPDDPSVLKDMIASLASELTNRDAELKSRDILIEKLKHQLVGLRRHQFGSRSESLEQLELTLEEEEIARAAEAPVLQDTAAPADKKRRPKRRPLPDHLPRNETVLSAGDACAACGGRLKQLGQDVTEELEYVPGRFIVNKIVRPRMPEMNDAGGQVQDDGAIAVLPQRPRPVPQTTVVARIIRVGPAVGIQIGQARPLAIEGAADIQIGAIANLVPGRPGLVDEIVVVDLALVAGAIVNAEG